MAETRRAHGAGLDLDHAVAMVHERTRQRYAAFGPDADPAVAARFEAVSGTASSVAGIMHWLDRKPQFLNGPSAAVPPARGSARWPAARWCRR